VVETEACCVGGLITGWFAICKLGALKGYANQDEDEAGLAGALISITAICGDYTWVLYQCSGFCRVSLTPSMGLKRWYVQRWLPSCHRSSDVGAI